MMFKSPHQRFSKKAYLEIMACEISDGSPCHGTSEKISLGNDKVGFIAAEGMPYEPVIVPHLSTPFKRDLSYHSVGSNFYTPEERDKEITIQTLERIIKKIKSY